MTELPSDAYEYLPLTIARVANCLGVGHERDTFLTGVFPVAAGAMPNVRFKYGKRWHSINVFSALIAPPGAGKGKFRIAKGCGKELDERLYKDSRDRIKEWERNRGNDDDDLGVRPREKTLYLPGDTSAAGMKKHLAANPHAVMFETEFKTIGTVLIQEWGDFRDVMLKSAQNEDVTVKRGEEDLLRIGHPALSVAISGTPNTFSEIIEDVEDGLYSRFLLYKFRPEQEWKSQFQDETDEKLDRAISAAATRLDNIHETLSVREEGAQEGLDEPLYITFPQARREQHTDVWHTIFESIKTTDVSEVLYANVKRAGLASLRLAAICAILRRVELGARLGEAKSIAISEADLYVGVLLASGYLSHAIDIAQDVESEDGRQTLFAEQGRYLDRLPRGAFETSEADEIAETMGIGERKAQRWRRKFADLNLLVDEGYGSWRRPSGSSEGGGITLCGIARMVFGDPEDLDDTPRVAGEDVQPTATQAAAPF